MARLLARLGRFSGRHRMLVPLTWALLLVVVAVIGITGMKFADGGFDVPGTQSNEAMELLDEEFPSTVPANTGSLQLVVADRNDAQLADHAATLSSVLDALRDEAFVESVSDPFDPAQPYVSPDGSTAVAQISVRNVDELDPESFTDELLQLAEPLADAGLRTAIGGSLAGEVPEILGPSEIVGAAIAFLVLMLTFGSLVAAGANMLGALVGVGVGVLGVLAVSSVAPIGQVTPILAVMLGLAVGIDYCLFILSRFRTELLGGKSVNEAIGIATGTAGSSVVFAGATVVIALIGLTVVGIPFLGEMGLAAAFAVTVAVAMSLTLLPALMALMGRRALPRRHRYQSAIATSRPHPNGFLTRWVAFVTRRPVVSALAGVLALVTVALPVTSMSTALVTPGGEDPGSTQRQAYNMISDAFGAGSQDPLVVLAHVAEGEIGDQVPALQVRLEQLAGSALVAPGGISEDGRTALLSVMSEHGPLEEGTLDLVHDIRALGELDGATLSVTGATAIGLDSDEQLQSALVLYLALVVGLSFVLLIVLFRSLLVPLIATLGFLLSLGAGLGATTAVFEWGWLDAVIPSPQGNPLLSLLPLIVTGILFGLAMDYQVFLVSRMHEAHERGAAPLEAIRLGFSRSALVVVAAAAIMAAVFGGFALSHSSLVASIAFALTVGVLADAFIVRMIVVPALLALLGRSAWWLPKWFDRFLPRIDVEGAALEQPAESSQVRAHANVR